MSVWSSEHEYLRAEWAQAQLHPVLGELTLAAVGDRPVERVLDIGCGAGQEVVPFVRERGARGIGVDVNVDSLRVARTLLDGAGVRDVELVCGRAEGLPVRSNGFDVVICRGVLVYTDIASAVGEISRVLRPGGVVIVQGGSARYELRALRRYVAERRTPQAKATARRLLAGVVYEVTGRQPANRWTGREVFFTRRGLRRQLAAAGLRVMGEVPFGNPRAITVVAERQP